MIRIIKSFMFILPLALIFVLGCSSDNGEEKQYLSMGASPVDLPYYQVASGITEVLNENMDNVSATTETTEGALENAERVTNGDIELSITDSRSATESYLGEGDFDSDDEDSIRTIMSFYRTHAQLITLEDSNINSLSDLKGKEVGVGQIGSASNFVFMYLLDLAGIDEDEFDPFEISTGEAVERMKDGQLDAVLQTGPMGVAPFLDLANARDVNLVQFDEDLIDQYLEDFPYETTSTIPAGTYEGVDEDIETLQFSHSIITQKDLDEDLIYEITKTIYENVDDLEKVHDSFENIDRETYNLDEVAIPLHPGAERYFEEEGASFDEYEAQMETLKE